MKLTCSCAQIVGLNSFQVILEELLEGGHVTHGQVHDVDVVPDAGAVSCLIISTKNYISCLNFIEKTIYFDHFR